MVGLLGLVSFSAVWLAPLWPGESLFSAVWHVLLAWRILGSLVGLMWPGKFLGGLAFLVGRLWPGEPRQSGWPAWPGEFLSCLVSLLWHGMFLGGLARLVGRLWPGKFLSSLVGRLWPGKFSAVWLAGCGLIGRQSGLPAAAR